MNKIKFGTFPLSSETFGNIESSAIEAEKLGYDSIWYTDHLLAVPSPTFEGWTTLSALAAATDTIRLGMMLTCNLFRNPSLLAKMATTVDVISKGRLEFGLGAGWHQKECDSFGISFPETSVRMAMLKESLEVVKRMWTEEEASFAGKYYRIEKIHLFPKPVQKPHPPIVIGGHGSVVTPMIAATYANAYNPRPFECTLDQAKGYLSTLERNCRKIGRHYESIEKILVAPVFISEDKNKVAELKKEEIRRLSHLRKKDMRTPRASVTMTGTPNEQIEMLEQYVKIGITSFIVTFYGEKPKEQMKLYSEEVISQFNSR